jgi:threonyl-tRNA synthetase
MIHAAIMGSLERFMSILIEHTAGVFPTWLSPVQVSTIPVSEKHFDYANSIVIKLKQAGIRAELDDSNETLGKKIRAWKLSKNPYALVVGDKEVESNMLSIEMRNGEKLSESVDAFIDRLKEEIGNRSL